MSNDFEHYLRQMYHDNCEERGNFNEALYTFEEYRILHEEWVLAKYCESTDDKKL